MPTDWQCAKLMLVKLKYDRMFFLCATNKTRKARRTNASFFINTNSRSSAASAQKCPMHKKNNKKISSTCWKLCSVLHFVLKSKAHTHTYTQRNSLTFR